MPLTMESVGLTPEMRISKKFLGEKILHPGAQVTLIRCMMGDCEKPRVVKERRTGNHFVMETPEGKESHLRLGGDDYVYLKDDKVYIVHEERREVVAAYKK